MAFTLKKLFQSARDAALKTGDVFDDVGSSLEKGAEAADLAFKKTGKFLSGNVEKSAETLTGKVKKVDKFLEEMRPDPKEATRLTFKKQREGLTPEEEEKFKKETEKIVLTTFPAVGTKDVARPLAKKGLPFVEKAVQKVRQSPRMVEMREILTDRLARIKDVVDNVRKNTGKELLEGTDPYKRMRNDSGSMGIGNLKTEAMAETIYDVYKKKKLRQPFEEYLVNQRIIELGEKKGIKAYNEITIQEARDKVVNIRESIGDKIYKQFQEARDNLTRFNEQELLNYVVDGGVMSKESAEFFKKKYPHYIRFQILENVADDLERLPGGRKSFNIPEQEVIQKLKGFEGKKTLENPLESTIRQIYKTVSLVERNKATQAYINLRNIDKSLADEIIPIEKVNNIAPKGMDKISAFFDGVKKEYFVPKEISEVIKGFNQGQIDLVTKLAAKAIGLLRAGATVYSPTFVLRNMFRDFQNAKIILGGKLGKGFGLKDWVGGFAEVIKKGPEYKEWVRNGGQFATYTRLATVTKKSTAAGKVLKKAVEGKTKRTIKTIINPAELLRVASTVIEETPRVGVFKKLRKQGVTGTEAAFKARNVTVDFSKAGSVGKIANLWVPFLNARVQGTLLLGEAFAKSPVSTIVRAGQVIAIPQVTTYLWNRQFESYKDLDQNIKNSNFVIMLGEYEDAKGKVQPQAIKIPKGDAGRMFGNPIESFLDYMTDNDSQSLNELAIKLLSDISPIPFERDGKLAIGPVIAATAPPPAQALAESEANYNYYAGYNIVPRSKEDLPPEYQYTNYTPETAKLIGKKLGKSPAKLFHVVRTTTGEAGTLPFILGDKLIQKITGKKPQRTLQEKLQMTPVIRGFYTARGGEIENQMHEALDRAELEVGGEKGEIGEKAMEYYEQHRLLEDNQQKNELLKLIIQEEKGEKIIEKMQKLAELEEEGLNSAERRLEYMDIKNTERAKGIANILNITDSQEKKDEYIDKWREVGIITTEVYNQLQVLRDKGLVDF